MPYKRYRFPIAHSIFRGKGIAMTAGDVPLWVPGDLEGDFGQALHIILGYLADIYQMQRPQEKPKLIAQRSLAQGQEFYEDFSDLLGGLNLMKVEVVIEKIGDDVDTFFGKSAVLHAGWASFTSELPPILFQSMGHTIWEVGIGSEFHSNLQYVNFGQSVFYPQSPEESGFWLKLKPTCTALIKVYSIQDTLPVEYECAPAPITVDPECGAHPDHWTAQIEQPFALKLIGNSEAGFFRVWSKADNAFDIPFSIGFSIPTYNGIPTTFAGQPLRLAIPDDTSGKFFGFGTGSGGVMQGHDSLYTLPFTGDSEGVTGGA